MRASVRHFISPDVDLDAFWPEDPDNFSFLLQALVGPADAEGEESLQFIVCTPQALEKRVALEGIVFGRSLVIVNSSDISRILSSIRASIERVEAPSWRALGGRLARLGVYE